MKSKAKFVELKKKAFKTIPEFRRWLIKNHKKSPGIWLILFKKDSQVKSINHYEALEEALCFGWIDGQANKHDEKSWLQKFTPRRARSIWSKRNTKIVTQLIEDKRMQAAGLLEIERAKEDGRWAKAYDSPKDMKVPSDFVTLIKKNKKAFEYYKTLSKTKLFAIGWRLQTAKKEETRLRRMKVILEMLEKGEFV